MNITREMMIEEVRGRIGLENPLTIWFCGLCEDSAESIDSLLSAMTFAIEVAFMEDEEEEDF